MECLANILRFPKAGECESHRHFKDHWTRFVSGGPFYVQVFFEGDKGLKGGMKSSNGPFGPGDSFFVHKDLIHKVISEGPGEAHCEFENDGTPNCGKECYGNPG